MLKQFAMPDVGEGLTEADILRWAVAPGDTVTVNQVIVEVETAKAAVELPSPFAGVVTELHAKEGDTVDVGVPIISIDVGGDELPGETGGPAEDLVPSPPAVESPERQPVLVGYGPRTGTIGRRVRRTSVSRTADASAPSVAGAFDTAPPAADDAAPAPAVDDEPAVTSPAAVSPPSGAPERPSVLAKPPVRKLAKDLGVDLGAVAATGPNGTVSRADVEQAARPVPAATIASTGRETRVPVRGVRKHTAAAMVASAFTAPHVTEFVTVDVTPTMELRDRVAARPEFRDVKLSPLVFLARAVILAAKRTPEINATWDEAAGEIVLKHYVNLGIAVATDRGLVVPNVKDADQLSLLDLAQAISAVTDTARAGRTTPADMAGGTLTITNVGVFGVDTGTPILNPGESGIVAFGAVRRMPWVVPAADGPEQIVPRWVTQLAVSFDHRLVDGQQGSQFLSDVAAVLTDPGLALL